MKLSYNILWFEDDNGSYAAKKEIVKAIVEDELGFLFPEPRREIDGRNINQIDYSGVDLILADLNLANNDKGADILDFIRNAEQVFTEVIFYSSAGEEKVRKALSEYRIDGAYCADRNNTDFEDKVRKVILTTIKKVQDLNNMRGLIMAETSDIDSTMLEIIKNVLEKDPGGIKKGLSEFIFQGVGSAVNEKKVKFDKYLEKNDLGKVIADPLMFDSHQKMLTLQYIIDAIDHKITEPFKKNSFLDKYTEIKRARNLLAHVIEVMEDGKRKLRSGDKELVFTDEFCIGIRKKIKEHGMYLTTLLLLVSN